jgi:Fe-S-cluster containining protein
LSELIDCRACGRCCYGQKDYVQVFAHDAERLGPARIAALVAEAVGEMPASPGRPAEPRRFMKMENGHCAALEISPSGRFTCTIHEHRPTVCRSLEPLTSPCLDAQREKSPWRGLPVPKSV